MQEICLGISALTPPLNTGDPLRTELEFADNRLLIDLCGEHDRNLARLESELGVQILRRGNHLQIMGEAASRERAVETLQALYSRLAEGRSLEAGDIDGAIRLGADPVGRETQLEMFRTGTVEIRTRKKNVIPRTKAQQDYTRALFEHPLNFGIGPAGTGKTYIAVAAAVHMFAEGHVDRIILSRPAVEAGERLGFLPGDMREKIDPYMQPLYDALNDFLPGRQLAKLMEERRIEIAPLAFMRGRTLANAFVVLDEAQNATEMQMKMFLTRLGEGSNMVVTGDRSQVDLPRGMPSGLAAAERILKDVKGVGFSYFTSADVVRHPLVARIIEAYERDEHR
jgi:phosphate starvation-inducible protein PhoH and related proteins